MKSVFAIGDIHGQSAMLNRLLELLPRDLADQLVFMGDYIDRGPESATVVETVKKEIQNGAIALWGNHEDMAAAAYGLESPGKFDRLQAGATWMHPQNGGPDTLRSYGTEYSASACPPALADLFPMLKLFHVEPELGMEFVHGYAPPGKTLVQAAARPSIGMSSGPAALLCGRPEAGAPELARFVVVGHTPQMGKLPSRLGSHFLIDTGSAFGGPLTAVHLRLGEPIVAYQVFPDLNCRIVREADPVEHPNAWELMEHHR